MDAAGSHNAPKTKARSRSPRPAPHGTLVSPASRWVLLMGFGLLMLLPGLSQLAMELSEPKPLPGSTEAGRDAQLPIAQRLRKLEKDLEEDSYIRTSYRQNFGAVLYASLREGNHKVVRGKGEVLHYRSDLDSILGRDPSKPVPKSVAKEVSNRDWVSSTDAVLDFAAQLRERGIQLMLVPVPSKVSIYPETLGLQPDRPIVNPRQEEIYQRMRGAGIDVVDLGPAFWTSHSRTPLFLSRDTHWTPGGVELAADEIAKAIKSYKDFPEMAKASQPLSSEAVAQAVTSAGDLDAQLGLREDSPLRRKETVLTRQIIDTNTAKPVERDPESPIVLVADSYAAIYSGESEGFEWGVNAGVSEHLMARLGVRIQAIYGLGGGATAARKALLETHGGLEGKKLVVWLLASRLLMLDEDGMKQMQEPWEKLRIPNGPGRYELEKAAAQDQAGQPVDTSLPEGVVAKVRAKVTAVANIPEPGGTPYPNLLVEVTCEPLETLAGTLPEGKFNVLTWGFRARKMSDNVPRPGDELQLSLASKVPQEFAQEQRSRVAMEFNEDGEMILVRTYWPVELMNLSTGAGQ